MGSIRVAAHAALGPARLLAVQSAGVGPIIGREFMPAPLFTKPEMFSRLMDLFREKGFDGASLADISESTGLGKSSLYHHFPNGKEERGLQALATLGQHLSVA